MEAPMPMTRSATRHAVRASAAIPIALLPLAALLLLAAAPAGAKGPPEAVRFAT